MPISVAILGAGIFARIAHLPAIRQLDGIYELKAIYSRSKNSSAELAKSAEETLAKGNQGGSSIQIYHDQGDPSTNLDALLARDDIQAVIVVLPINLQPSIIVKSLAAGKHVISEKPVAPTVKDGIELIKTYEETYKPKGLIWRVAENFEAEPGLRAAARAIAEQKIGKVCFWNMQVLNSVDTDSMWYNTPWRTVPEYQGGFLLDGGVHSTAALRVVVPSPFKELTGFASLARKHLAPHDTIHAVIRSEDGSHGVLELTWGLPSVSGSDLFRVVGSEGVLTVSRFNKKNEETGKDESFYKVEIVKGGSGAKEEIVEKSCGVLKELENFANHLSGNDDGLGSPLGALKDVSIIQAALDSNGSVIDLQKLVKGI